MEFFQKKTGQVIALVTIIGTLAGFGYTGATYVNRLENLEKLKTKNKAMDEEAWRAFETPPALQTTKPKAPTPGSITARASKISVLS